VNTKNYENYTNFIIFFAYTFLTLQVFIILNSKNHARKATNEFFGCIFDLFQISLTCFFQKQFQKKSARKKQMSQKKQNFRKKKGKNLFSKQHKLSLKQIFIFIKINIFLTKQKAPKLSVFENGYFRFCPQINIIFNSPHGI
jgi:hypothetical protein